MRVNLNHYVVTKKFIQTWQLQNANRDVVYNISLISASIHVPAIASAFYIGEVMGWPQAVLDNISSLIDSYDYIEIIGIPDEYPGRRI